jgi:hypothetical protein
MAADNMVGSENGILYHHRFWEYSPTKVRKIQIQGRPNKGIPKNRGWVANPNTLDRSRIGPYLLSAPP